MGERAITKLTVLTQLSLLEEAQRRVATALSSYAENPLPGGTQEEALVKALEARKEATARAGMAILEWRAHGGTVTFSEPLRVIEEPLPEEPSVDFEDGPVLEEDTPVKMPPPRAPSAVIAPPPPASPESLQKLMERVNGGDAKDTSPPTPKRSALKDILKSLGKPQEILTSEDYYREVDILRRVSESASEKWEGFADDIRRALTGLVSSRARHVQDEAPHGIGQGLLSIDPVFSQLTSYSAEYRPGFVRGLSRRHEPYGDSWLGDAQGWWDDLRSMAGYGQSATDSLDEELNPDREIQALQTLLDNNPQKEDVEEAALRCLEAGVASDDPRLVKSLNPYHKFLKNKTKFKALRKAIREYKEMLAKEQKESEEDTAVLPEDWPHWNLTRDKVAVIVGGDKRDTAMRTYKDVFGFSQVEWEESGEPRRLESLCKRVESGAVDMIILLARFTSHAASYILVPACKESGVPFILVERGYGVSQARATMEKVLPRFQGE